MGLQHSKAQIMPSPQLHGCKEQCPSIVRSCRKNHLEVIPKCTAGKPQSQAILANSE